MSSNIGSITGQGSEVTYGENVQLFPVWGAGWVFSVTGRIISIDSIRAEISEDLEQFDGLTSPKFSSFNSHWTDLFAVQQMLIRCEINGQPWNINSQPIDHIAALRNFMLNCRQRNAPKVGVYTVDWNTWIPERFAFNNYLVSSASTINADPYHPYNNNAAEKYKSLRGHADSYRTGDKFLVDEFNGDIIRLSDGITWKNPYGGTVVRYEGVDRENEKITFNTGDVFSMKEWRWLVNSGDSGNGSGSGSGTGPGSGSGSAEETILGKYFKKLLTDTKVQIWAIAILLILIYILKIRK